MYEFPTPIEGGGVSKLKRMVRAYERQLIEAALAAAQGNQRQAAAQLGVLPTTLYEKMKRLGLKKRAIDRGRPALADPRPRS